MIHIIAEAGTNHGGNVKVARQLIDVAANAEADSVKFQLIYPEGLYLPQLYKNGKYEDYEVFEVRKKGMISDDEFLILEEYAQTSNISLSASIFDEKGIRLLDQINAPYIKIASCDLNNSKLLMRAAETGRTVIVSTGMATLIEIERAVKDYLSTGNQKLVLMHCVSIYPCPTEQVNIGFIDELKSAFGLSVGFSDHTENSIAAIMAVSKGVEWIEKHFTLKRTLKGFDHAYAMEPDMLKTYITDIRAAEAACKKPMLKVSDLEALVKSRARRGLYSARDINSGETIAEADILAVRPSASLSPNDAKRIIGKVAKKSISKYEPFEWDVFQ